MFTVFLFAALLHPVHETVSEIQWNAKTERLEVALRLHVLDEQWLRKNVSRGEDDISKWAAGYLRQTFRVSKPPKKQQDDSAKYRWIGRDEEGPHVWWFFEIETAQRKRPTWIDVRILYDREDSYTNRILILDQVPRRSLTLTIQRPKANLNQAANETNAVQPTSNPPTDRRSRLDR